MESLTQYGLPGAIITVILTGMGVLYRDNLRLRDKLIEIQNARIQDAKEMTTKITEPLDLIGRSQRLIFEKLDGVKREP